MDFKTLIINIDKRSDQSKNYSHMIKLLKKHYPNNIILTPSIPKLFKLFKKSKKGNFKYIFNNILLLSYRIPINIKEIFYCRDEYFLTLRNCIVDQIERETGTLSRKINSNRYIIKNILNFLAKSFKLQIFLNIVDLIIEKKDIEAIFIDQLDGFPYSAITALSIRKDIYIGTFEPNKKKIILRKGFLNDWNPLMEDLYNAKKMNPNLLNNKLEIYKETYIAHKDKVCSPTGEYKVNLKDINFFKNIYNNKKKNAVVLLHVFTDQARIRLQGTWYESYFDWFLETINFCKLNENINWFFKSHPYEKNYPLSKRFNNFIEEKISENNFVHIDSSKNLLHGELSQFASVIITCTGTCKLEYPALFNIPVISCFGNYLLYEPLLYPHVAKSREDYRELILNAHNLKLSEEDIAKYKEGLYGYRNNLDYSVDHFKIKVLSDMVGGKVFRNY